MAAIQGEISILPLETAGQQIHRLRRTGQFLHDSHQLFIAVDILESIADILAVDDLKTQEAVERRSRRVRRLHNDHIAAGLIVRLENTAIQLDITVPQEDVLDRLAYVGLARSRGSSHRTGRLLSDQDSRFIFQFDKITGRCFFDFFRGFFKGLIRSFDRGLFRALRRSLFRNLRGDILRSLRRGLLGLFLVQFRGFLCHETGFFVRVFAPIHGETFCFINRYVVSRHIGRALVPILCCWRFQHIRFNGSHAFSVSRCLLRIGHRMCFLCFGRDDILCGLFILRRLRQITYDIFIGIRDIRRCIRVIFTSGNRHWFLSSRNILFGDSFSRRCSIVKDLIPIFFNWLLIRDIILRLFHSSRELGSLHDGSSACRILLRLIVGIIRSFPSTIDTVLWIRVGCPQQGHSWGIMRSSEKPPRSRFSSTWGIIMFRFETLMRFPGINSSPSIKERLCRLARLTSQPSISTGSKIATGATSPVRLGFHSMV